MADHKFPLSGESSPFLRLDYLGGYPEKVREQTRRLVQEDRLGTFLREKYPVAHQVRSDRALYQFAMAIKNRFLRSSPPLSKVVYDFRIDAVNNALGLHTYVSRVQGSRLKAKNEIRIAAVFREAPEEFLRMIVVHELAHLREKDHGSSFYSLCEHMEPDYHRLELDSRLYLTYLSLGGKVYGGS